MFTFYGKDENDPDTNELYTNYIDILIFLSLVLVDYSLPLLSNTETYNGSNSSFAFFLKFLLHGFLL